MVMSFIKKTTDNIPNKNLKFRLHNHLKGRDEPRSLERVHASEVTKPDGFCPRYYALYDKTSLGPQGQWLSTSEKVTFKMGHDLQDSVVNWFADMDLAVGNWSCLSCDTVHKLMKRPYKCTKCQAKGFKPIEVRFKSTYSDISCGIDMLVMLGGTKLIPVEIKTMDKDQFKALVAPLAEHRIRTSLYLKCIAESSHEFSEQVDTDNAKIFYVSKGGYGCADPDLFKWGLNEKFSPFKEFDIKRDDSILKDLEVPALVLKEFRAGKSGVPCGICSTAMTKRATYCAMKKDCWSGDFPPEVQWKGCAS